MLIKDTRTPLKAFINMTLEEMFLLSMWIRTVSGFVEMPEILVIQNGCDVVDYYVALVTFADSQDKKKLLKFIRSLSQESNFGGERHNEHWITPLDAGLTISRVGL